MIRREISTIWHTVSILDCNTISQNVISESHVATNYAIKSKAMICQEQPYRKRFP